MADARRMMQLRSGQIIDKTRFRIRYADKIWEIDEFHGALEGLILAEVELAMENEKTSVPSWVGKEVTTNPAYYNQSLALKGQPEKPNEDTKFSSN
jgi:CYTH domain-containing protein